MCSLLVAAASQPPGLPATVFPSRGALSSCCPPCPHIWVPCICCPLCPSMLAAATTVTMKRWSASTMDWNTLDTPCAFLYLTLKSTLSLAEVPTPPCGHPAGLGVMTFLLQVTELESWQTDDSNLSP